jgi:acyl-CoA thioester hydrolase
MADFRFYHEVQARYGDLDPQGHVNNARYFTYMEMARIVYFRDLGLWSTDSFINLGVILADIHISFKASIQFAQRLRVGARVSRIGNKSMTMDNVLEDLDGRLLYATGTSTLVAYDYRLGASVPISDEWRQKIIAFEDFLPEP